MGCVWNYKKLHATSDEVAVLEAKKLIRDAFIVEEFGGYSGTFAEASGVVLITPENWIPTSEGAEEYLSGRCCKWGSAKVVMDSSGSYHVGAACSE